MNERPTPVPNARDTRLPYDGLQDGHIRAALVIACAALASSVRPRAQMVPSLTCPACPAVPCPAPPTIPACPPCPACPAAPPMNPTPRAACSSIGAPRP